MAELLTSGFYTLLITIRKGVIQGSSGKNVLQNFNALNFGASYWLSVESASQCKREVKIDEKMCVEQFKRMLDGCDGNEKISLGGSAVAGCSRYNITMDIEGSENSPPWNRKMKKPNSCSIENSRVMGNWFDSMITKFCDGIESNGKEKGLKKQYIDKDATRKPKRSTLLEKCVPPPTLQKYPGYKFNFEWTGGSNCQMTC